MGTRRELILFLLKVFKTIEAIIHIAITNRAVRNYLNRSWLQRGL